METLAKSLTHHVDLESDAGDAADGGGGGGRSSYPEEGHGHSSAGEHKSEIVRELDNDDNNNNNNNNKRRESSASDCSVELDLEAGRGEARVEEPGKPERDCRICHLSLDPSNQEASGVPIELGCSCKDDLAAAHRQCAETWFKIKGNKTCEICGSIARNVAGVPETELSEDEDPAAAHNTTAHPVAETRNFWQGHRFLNFLLACMVFAFVISWLFHFNVPS